MRCRNLFRFFILLCVFLGLVTPAFAVIKSSGDIELVADEPLYPSSILWYPGFTQQKSFQVKNRGNSTKTVQIEALSELQTNSLARGLSFEVRENGKTMYGSSPSKTMQNFFDDGTISLSDVPVDDNGKVYDILVTMPLSSGNEYQQGKATFDLRVGFPGDAQSSVIIASNTVEPSPTPTSAVLGKTITSGSGQSSVLGEEIAPPADATEPEQQLSPNSNGEVAGAEKTPCSDPWWKFLLLSVEGILLIGTALLLGRKNTTIWLLVLAVCTVLPALLVGVLFCDKTPWLIGVAAISLGGFLVRSFLSSHQEAE